MELWDPTSNWFLGPSCSPSYSFFALIFFEKKTLVFRPWPWQLPHHVHGSHQDRWLADREIGEAGIPMTHDGSMGICHKNTPEKTNMTCWKTPTIWVDVSLYLHHHHHHHHHHHQMIIFIISHYKWWFSHCPVGFPGSGFPPAGGQSPPGWRPITTCLGIMGIPHGKPLGCHGKPNILGWGIDPRYIYLGGGNSNICYFHPYLGKWSKLTIIFFRWVETTT